MRHRRHRRPLCCGTFAWSIGLAYVSYDTALLLFVFLQTLPLRHPSKPGAVTGEDHKLLGVGVIVAAHNEAAVLPVCLTALFAQTTPPDEVVIADDGSDDAPADLLTPYLRSGATRPW
jgi:cellulose synthase/poly-beta-1,6-N-acetylglucosamine synthase-like glycosyltransferase